MSTNRSPWCAEAPPLSLSAPAVPAAVITTLFLSGFPVIIAAFVSIALLAWPTIVLVGSGGRNRTTRGETAAPFQARHGALFGLGIVIGVIVVAVGVPRIARSERPPVSSIAATGDLVLTGVAREDLRPSARPARSISVQCIACRDRRGWRGSVAGDLVLRWESSDTLRTTDGDTRRTPIRGDTIVARVSATDLQRGVAWVNAEELRLTPQRDRPGLFRRSVRRGIFARFRRIDATARGVMSALLLGDRGGIDESVYDAVRKSGAAHVLALSGMHLGILAALLGSVVSRVLSPRPAAVIILTGLSFYVWIAGAIPSLLRAMAMVAVAAAARLTDRRVPPIVVLARAVLFLLVIDPTLARDIGFQYSVAALTGMFVVAPRVNAYLEYVAPRWLALYAGTSFAAMISVAPLSVAVFGTIYPGGVIFAGVLSLIVVGVMWTGILFAFVAEVPLLGTVAGGVVEGFTRLLIVVAGIGARVPPLDLTDSQGVTTALLIATAVAVLFAGILLLRRRDRRIVRRKEVTAGESQLDF